ncbi:drug/metabolite transporter (DMT)-like permease [Kitasatospora sp. MAP12-15]|uniref:DMT family transporter n=1 Tax=unclassified Kitasatospora TaxID=2633591 RepID=UPI0024756663|nr:DMT family transporter [Kitasatospora sp. MAP12-44]MDH6112372.1 drug/metabolite transporter (DMT)-like permease [Kitasatospora sp. MAP12-44]
MRTPSQAAAPRGIVTDLPVLLVAVVWGSSYLAVKHLATPQSVVAMLVLRFGLVLPVLGLFARRGLRGLGRAEWLGGALLGGILGSIFLLESYGVVHTTATNAGLIISLTMVFTPLAESLVGRADGRVPLPRAFVVAAGLSVLGVGLLTQGAGLHAPSVGDLLVFGAAVVRTAHVLAMSRARALKDTDSLALTWVQLAAAAVVFALVSPFAGSSPWSLAASYGPGQWADLLYLAVFCTLVAFLVQMWAVRATSPSRVSLLLGTEPLWAAVVGIVLGGDRLVPLAFCGGLLVLAGTEWGRRVLVPGAPEPLPA